MTKHCAPHAFEGRGKFIMPHYFGDMIVKMLGSWSNNCLH